MLFFVDEPTFYTIYRILESMNKLYLLFLLLIPVSGLSQSIDDYPEITDVLDHFYQTYQSTAGEGQVISFARKYDGWHIQKQPYGKRDKVIDSEIYWSIETQDYLPLRYQKLPLDASPNIAYHRSRYFRITNWNQYNYERCLFYGYPRWAEDMVQVLSEKEPLSPQNLEGLSRAYDFLANQVLYSTYGITHPIYQPLEGQRLEDEDRLATYLSYMDRSISLLAELAARSPDYPLLVGSPEIKLANQYMTAWLHLTGAGHPHLAKKYALQAEYDEFTTRMSSFQFEAIPPNGHFISQGDNDFFPFIALQLQEQRRMDVTIIHAKLLLTPWYQGVMMDSLGVSFPNEQLDQLRKGYVTLAGRPDTVRSRLAGSQTILSVPTNVHGTSRYLLANEMILLKLIENSNAQHPLCLSWFSDLGAFSYLSDHCVVKGLTYQLTSTPPQHDRYDPMMQQFGYLETDSATSTLDGLLSSDISWLAEGWDSNPSNTLSGTGLMRWWVTVMYHHSQLLDTIASATVEDVQRRDQLVAWSNALERICDKPDITMAYLAAELAVIGYSSDLEWMGLSWEKYLYACLDEVDWEQSSRQDLDVRRGLLALEVMGYYFQESERDVQKISLEQRLGQYESRLLDF